MTTTTSDVDNLGSASAMDDASSGTAKASPASGASKKDKYTPDYRMNWAMFHARLAQAREDAGLTLVRTEELTGVNRVRISDVELSSEPGMYMLLYALAKAYQVRPDWLFGFTDQMEFSTLDRTRFRSDTTMKLANIVDDLPSAIQQQMLLLAQTIHVQLDRRDNRIVSLLVKLLTQFDLPEGGMEDLRAVLEEAGMAHVLDQELSAALAADGDSVLLDSSSPRHRPMTARAPLPS